MSHQMDPNGNHEDEYERRIKEFERSVDISSARYYEQGYMPTAHSYAQPTAYFYAQPTVHYYAQPTIAHFHGHPTALHYAQPTLYYGQPIPHYYGQRPGGPGAFYYGTHHWNRYQMRPRAVDPVDRLPNELMFKIFSFASRGDLQGAFRLARVSRRWRALAIGCRDIWTDVSFGPGKIDLTRICLDRSGMQPLSITISDHCYWRLSQAEFVWKVNAFVWHILPHKDRWRTLEFATCHLEDDHDGYSPTERAASNSVPPDSIMEIFSSRSLEELSIQSYCDSQPLNPYCYRTFWTTILSESASRFPNLRVLSLDDYIPTLPRSTPVIQSVTKLNLCYGGEQDEMGYGLEDNPELDFRALTSVLRKLPRLQQLSIEFSALDVVNESADEDIFIIPIVFPDLVQLELEVTDSDGSQLEKFSRLLSRCQFPRVTTMHLTFELNSMDPTHWTIDLFQTDNNFPSLETLDLKISLYLDEYYRDVQMIDIPVEKMPSLKKLSVYFFTMKPSIKFTSKFGDGVGRPGVKFPALNFPALRYLDVHADWYEQAVPQDQARQWIARIVRELKARRTWESFERLSVVLAKSRARAKFAPGTLSAWNRDEDLVKVYYSRREVEELLKNML